MNEIKRRADRRELADSELEAVSGGRRLSTIHPAKVIVPEIKLTVSYSG